MGSATRDGRIASRPDRAVRGSRLSSTPRTELERNSHGRWTNRQRSSGRHDRLATEMARAIQRTSSGSRSPGGMPIGLDGDKKPIDSLTSNIGHLLWTGIVPTDRAKRLAQHLVDPAMFTGWGVRTLASAEPGVQPTLVPLRVGLASRYGDCRGRLGPLSLRRRSLDGLPRGSCELQRRPAAASPSCLPASRQRTFRPPFPTRRRARRRPGRPPRRYCWSDRCSVWIPMCHAASCESDLVSQEG